MWTLLIAAALAITPVAARDLLSTDGVEHIRELDTLSFTFNVERDGELKGSRSWSWEPKTDRVTRTVDGESLTFTFGAPEGEEQTRADAQFVNDSFWLMPQLHVSWAPVGVVVSSKGMQPLPIGEGEARQLTVQYPDTGGYTPGDAYDLFLDPDGHIVAWHFRQGGQAEPSSTTTFDAPILAGPLRIVTEHRSADGAFRLYFTDVHVTGGPEVPTSATGQAVAKQLQEASSAKECFVPSFEAGGLPERIDLDLVVSPAGELLSAVVRQAEHRGELQACLAAAVRAGSPYPKTGAEVLVHYPFVVQ